MSDRYWMAFVMLVASASAAGPAAAQSREPAAPTVANIVKLIRSGAGYAELVRQSLRWTTPASGQCGNIRTRIDQGFIPVPDSFGGPELASSAEARVEAWQRAEENLLAQLAVFSSQIYDAVRFDCLVLPEQAPYPEPPPRP